MNPLNPREIAMIRGFEKEGDTTEPKKIWVRGWHSMVARHLGVDLEDFVDGNV